MSGRCLCGFLRTTADAIEHLPSAGLVVHGHRYCFTVMRDAVVPHPVSTVRRPWFALRAA